eukprot:CAMPEP_0172686438 /NCGR_PEP_ID=MMETSP1074-20121228/20937_1 /TAXON_ID=2916 /ORGANISM="Ceratium fusus, Strain PA161109" /LENGTH=31 /DNA_ID= /DNA_START= /DNA_END= /DNA_ORIENTATION=
MALMSVGVEVSQPAAINEITFGITSTTSKNW